MFVKQPPYLNPLHPLLNIPASTSYRQWILSVASLDRKENNIPSPMNCKRKPVLKPQQYRTVQLEITFQVLPIGKL